MMSESIRASEAVSDAAWWASWTSEQTARRLRERRIAIATSAVERAAMARVAVALKGGAR